MVKKLNLHIEPDGYIDKDGSIKFTSMSICPGFIKNMPIFLKKTINDNTTKGKRMIGHKIEKGKQYFIMETESRTGDFALWWKPNSKGYTFDVDKAGIYTAEEAKSIVGIRGSDLAFEKNFILEKAFRCVFKDEIVKY